MLTDTRREYHTPIFSQEEDHLEVSVVTDADLSDLYDPDVQRDVYHIYANVWSQKVRMSGFSTTCSDDVEYYIRRLWSFKLNPSHRENMRNVIGIFRDGRLQSHDSNRTRPRGTKELTVGRSRAIQPTHPVTKSCGFSSRRTVLRPSTRWWSQFVAAIHLYRPLLFLPKRYLRDDIEQKPQEAFSNASFPNLGQLYSLDQHNGWTIKLEAGPYIVSRHSNTTSLPLEDELQILADFSRDYASLTTVMPYVVLLL